jgi:hypothetical protein
MSNYPVEKESPVPFVMRGDSFDSKVNTMLPNGGLYSGVEVERAMIPKKIEPTSTYFTTELLKEANPPPGAIEQAVGTNRPGNNYTAAPSVYWYNNTTKVNNGPFNLKVVQSLNCKE